MLRFLSNYIFQNENESDGNEPLNDEQRPNDDKGIQPGASGEFMDFVEDGRDGGDDEEDDWVLIGGENGKKEEDEKEQGVALVAPGDDEQVVQDEDNDQDDDEASDQVPPLEKPEKNDQEPEPEGLLWENKLIEHPSMSVYIDLATSITNEMTSCISLSSIAPTSSPGDSVIVLEDPDSESDDDMDILDSVELLFPQPKVAKSDIENVNTMNPPKKALPSPPVSNGRRKKGHYPCSSSNTGNMPRRHVRNGNRTPAFQMISSTSWTAPSGNGTSLPSIQVPLEIPGGKKKRGNNGSTVPGASGASACGIATVGATPMPSFNPPGSIWNKSLKLFQNEAPRQHKQASKAVASKKGHYLQESTRRSHLQNYTKHACVNNDRRTASQRKDPKGSNGGAGARK